MDSTLPISQDPTAAAPSGGAPLHEHHGFLHHAIFMPRHGEPIHAYVARLRAVQHHLTMLIEAVERGMHHRPVEEPRISVRHPRLGATPKVLSATAPGLGRAPSSPAFADRPAAAVLAPTAEPATERRRDRLDRRVGGRRDRRQGSRDRRRGLPDTRADKVERRSGVIDRRSGRRDRRLGHDRRAEVRRVSGPAVASPPMPSMQVDAIAVFWGVNIVCWLGITAVAMIWGVG